MKLTPGQRKIAGIIVTLIFGLIELLFIVVLIGMIVTNDETAKTSNLVSFLFCIGMFSFPLWWGINLWKSGIEASRGTPGIPDFTTIKVQVKIDLAQYRKLLFQLTYTKPLLIYIHFIGLTMLFFYAMNGNGDNWFALVIVVLILSFPVSIIRTASSNYKSQKALHESVTYEFTPHAIITTGDSFSSTLQWNMVFKVQDSGPWLLVYTNNQTAMLIPKSAFSSPADIAIIKQMARTTK